MKIKTEPAANDWSPDRGAIRWQSKRPTNSSTSDKPSDLAHLLMRLTRWSPDGFAREWFAGEYRLLTLTCELPTDSDVVITCHSEPIDEYIDFRLTVTTRSKGLPRRLDDAERESVTALEFGQVTDTGVEAGFPTGIEEMQMQRVADQIVSFVKKVFSSSIRKARYELIRGSRLDSMWVFQDIRLTELVSLLRAAGFDAAPQDLAASPDTTEQGRIIVNGEQPYAIDLKEPREDRFLTLLFSTSFPEPFPPGQINVLNGLLPVGAALLTEEGRLLLRFSLCVSGGMSHAAIRDRVDEFNSSVKAASKMVATLMPSMPEGIM